MAAAWIAERKLHKCVFTATSNSMAYSKWPFIIGSRPPSSLNSQSWIADSIFILNGCHLLEQAGCQKRYTFIMCVFVCGHTWLQILAGQRGVDDLVLCRVCLCSWSLQCGGVRQWWICVRVCVKFVAGLSNTIGMCGGSAVMNCIVPVCVCVRVCVELGCLIWGRGWCCTRHVLVYSTLFVVTLCFVILLLICQSVCSTKPGTFCFHVFCNTTGKLDFFVCVLCVPAWIQNCFLLVLLHFTCQLRFVKVSLSVTGTDL